MECEGSLIFNLGRIDDDPDEPRRVLIMTWRSFNGLKKSILRVMDDSCGIEGITAYERLKIYNHSHWLYTKIRLAREDAEREDNEIDQFLTNGFSDDMGDPVEPEYDEGLDGLDEFDL